MGDCRGLARLGQSWTKPRYRNAYQKLTDQESKLASKNHFQDVKFVVIFY